MSPQKNSYQDNNGKPTQPQDEPIDPKDPDVPVIEDPIEPTAPEDPVPEPVKAGNRYDPNNLLNYIRVPTKEHIH